MSEEVTRLKKEQRKESILTSALKVMLEKGIQATTMRDIANTEGISETLLYRFFQNKEEVILNIIETKVKKTLKGFGELTVVLQGMVPDPKVTLPIIWNLVKSKLLENNDLIALMLREMEYMQKHFEELRSQFTIKNKRPFGFHLHEMIQKLQIEEIFNDYFKRCQEAGTIRKEIDVKYITRMFLRILSIPVMPNPMLMKNMPFELSEEDLDRFMLAQIDILINGIAKEKITNS